MLKITIPGVELYDEVKEEFTSVKGQLLQLEHSLVSLSKWESKWHTPFLSKDEKTTAETVDYIKCMTLTQNVDESVYANVSDDNILAVQKYIESPMTATTFSKGDNKPSREIITAEIIYHWMISFNIPFECKKWHLDRLLTLISVCSIKNAPPKKMGKKDTANRNTSLNKARREALRSSG